MAGGLPIEENFLGLEASQSDPETSRVIVVPAPFEATSSYGTGSRRGPGAILEASHHVEFYDCALGFEPVQACGGIATVAPVPFHDLLQKEGETAGAAFADRLEEAVGRWLDAGKFVVTLGGEHSSIVGAFRAHAKRFHDLTVLQLDAHSDLRDEYLDNPWSHASALRRILDFHDHAVQVGIRSEESKERETAGELGVKTFYGHVIARQAEAGEDWISGVVSAARERVYVTLDADVFDPPLVPATGTPEPGGLTWHQMDRLLQRLCSEREVVGFDVSELAPIEGVRVSEYTLAKIIYRFIGYRFG
ncbi:MAG: agmatinase [Candidatus Hydrogenedentes bacterium]|nr:agmatinase [Candidatus Hydrogenedentota bacterium]